VLILLGLPIPKIDDFIEEAQAFLYDRVSLEFNWTNKSQHLEMTDGEKVEVKVGGYWEGPEAAYYWQKCQAGLFQALHRIRPYIPRDYDRHVFIYTNMPVPEVKLTGLLRSRTNQRTHSRNERALAILKDQLKSEGQCTLSDLAVALVGKNETDGQIRKWIQRKASNLAEATSSEFDVGNGRRVGRFIRQ